MMPDEIKDPRLAHSTLMLVFIHLAKECVKNSKNILPSMLQTRSFMKATSGINALFKDVVMPMSFNYKKAIQEVGNYYFVVVTLANQAANMDGMVKAMRKYLEDEDTGSNTERSTQ